MAFEHFSYDPITGVTTLFDYIDEDSRVVLKQVQDVEPVLRYAEHMRREQVKHVYNRPEEEWFLEAVIPTMTMVEMKQKGIDVGNPAHTKEVAKEIEQNYPNLKCTDLKLWRPT